MADYSIAVDIGGTFTDVVLRHADGRTWFEKKLTTYANLLDGFFAAVDSVLQQAEIGAGRVDDVVVHATTLVTNSIIQRSGAKTALLVTKGFSDILILRDECRTNIFDNQVEVSVPLVPRELTCGVTERTLADGSIMTEPDLREIAAIVDALKAAGVKSVAVCLLHAYANPHNEKVIGAAIQERAPEMFVSLSSDVAPQIREYPRASTTAMNAYARPLTEPYLRDLVARLRAHGFRQDPLIMLSSGGVIGAKVAGEYPVRMIESGPAAGALAASYWSARLGHPNLLAFDMGGTTAKACFIENGEPLVAGTFEVDRVYRFQPGSGLPITIPCIDMIEIGAGGGSIAGSDELKLLTVGPQSAGSDPGPACYGRGGRRATVTDADLVLGFLDPDNFLGGDMPLDKPAALEAFSALGREIGVSAQQAAFGVYRLVGDSMASAIRAHALDRGIDWRGVPILAFGGAGPVHACHVAELLDATRVIFPPLASVLSAFGTLVSPVRLDIARGRTERLRSLDWSTVEEIAAGLKEQASAALLEAGCRRDAIQFSFAADMRYLGQQNEVTVQIPERQLLGRDADRLRELFEAAYQRQYGVRIADVEVEFVTWRVRAFGPEPDRSLTSNLGRTKPRPAHVRSVQFPSGAADAKVYARALLPRGEVAAGPALIEERETTLVVPPGWEYVVDGTDCVVATRR